MNMNPLRGLTRVIQIITAVGFCFIVIEGYPFGYPNLQMATVNLLIFACAGFTIVFVPNIILNAIMLVAAIPVINFDVANWNSHLQGIEIKNGWFLVLLYCGVGVLLSVGYLIYRLFHYLVEM